MVDRRGLKKQTRKKKETDYVHTAKAVFLLRYLNGEDVSKARVFQTHNKR